MLNFAENEPPRKLKINGSTYKIATDFKVWIRVSRLLEEMDKDDLSSCVRSAAKISKIVFGKLINEPAGDMLKAVVWFLKGYPKRRSAPEFGDAGHEERIFSFETDLNALIIAIRNQSGIDLSYRRTEPFHWWEFLLEIETLEDRHAICKIMGYRAYSGENKDLLMLKQKYALSENSFHSHAENELEKFSGLFYD